MAIEQDRHQQQGRVKKGAKAKKTVKEVWRAQLVINPDLGQSLTIQQDHHQQGRARKMGKEAKAKKRVKEARRAQPVINLGLASLDLVDLVDLDLTGNPQAHCKVCWEKCLVW